MDPVTIIEITTAPLATETLLARLADPENGALVTFHGVVRNNSEGQPTLHLEYEAYPDMARVTLQQIADEIRVRWPDVRHIALVHRIGRLEIGETAVIIALTAAHRPQLFDALRYAIDRLKQIVPIWKKEVRPDGAEWKSEV